jgi:phosphatidate phosphatase PAH1
MIMKQVEVAVNGKSAANLSMKVGDAGEAFFVVETDVREHAF